MRVVIDTNVFLSGLLRGRTPKTVLLALIERRFQLLISETLLEELVDVLRRPEWIKILDASESKELIAIIRDAAIFVRPKVRISACRDPEDNAILECAVAGRAAFLVTGDRDLLTLNPFRGIKIVRPAEFLRLLS